MTIDHPDLPNQVLDHETLFGRLQAGHTLITGNSRLSRFLTGEYNQWHVKQGDRQWQSPAIFSWNVWLDKLWEVASLQGLAGTDRAVPGNRQLINLWESTLRNEPVKHQLLHPESLAEQLRDTRKLITEWHLDFKDSSWFGGENENYTAFYYWNRGFESLCESGNWIAPEDRITVLCKALEAGNWKAAENIDLLGFDEFSPAQESLLNAISDSGSSVSMLAITPQRESAVMWRSTDSKTGLQQMARWVRYWYEKEPQATIAIVVPDLQSHRREVERVLEEILTPAANRDGDKSGSTDGDRLAKPWNISIGTALARVPMIETAFDLLKMLDERVNIQDIGRVLKSPWLKGGVSERNSRALLEKYLRESYPRQLKTSSVKFHAGEIRTRNRRGEDLPPGQHEARAWNSPVLHTVLERLLRFSRDNKKERSPSAWAESFDQLLINLGWPQDQHDANREALQAWRDALRELATLDCTSAVLNCKAAVKQLNQICREKVFQPHTPAARIQVLGLYEISGLRFDHLWVVDLHKDNWPAGARPSPFIPGKLQLEAQIPNSSPRRELEVARIITNRLLDTAPDCVFSYAGIVDGEDTLPSPLISTKVTETDEAPPAWKGKNWPQLVAEADRPQLVPFKAPGKLGDEKARGGSSILRHQALCPFRAFASNRLGASGMDSPVDGISAWLHGSLVHKVLETFWIETRTQAALKQLDKNALTERVAKHVDAAIRENKGLRQRPAFMGVEATRLQRHVMNYLALEKTREDFEVIANEKEINPEIAGHSIHLLIDRVDRLKTGEEIIIDYKTGTVKPEKWFGERPDEPQLPLYALHSRETPAAVVFGIVREDGCEFKGVVRREGLLPALPPKANSRTQELVDAGHNMPETIEKWRKTLHSLMVEFLNGKAAIDPKDGENTCKNSFCELQPLCRIGELQQRRSAQVGAGQ